MAQHTGDGGAAFKATIKLNYSMNGDYVLGVQSSIPGQMLTYQISHQCIA